MTTAPRFPPGPPPRKYTTFILVRLPYNQLDRLERSNVPYAIVLTVKTLYSTPSSVQ